LTGQVTCVENTISALDDESSDRKQLEELLSTSGLPPLTTVQALCSNAANTTASNGSVHASPNTTPQPTPPGTPSSIRKLAKLAQQGMCICVELLTDAATW